jgi:uncharacterized membrane protein YraQ (UPF0718 family)
MLLPVASHVDLRVDIDRIGVVIAWWSSIVLASLPYVTIGVIVSFAVERSRPPARWLAVAAIIAPGCDCASAGYAPALVRATPALAGFAFVWSAAAGPAALFATLNALGPHLLLARLGGAFAAAGLTSLLWSVDRHVRAAKAGSSGPHSCAIAPHVQPSICDRIASAIGALALSSTFATVALAFGRGATLSTPLTAAVAGALLSPGSTSDSVLARVLAHHAGSQISFVLASQTIDVRQLTTIARVFGARRAALAAIAGAMGCVVGVLCAR